MSDTRISVELAVRQIDAIPGLTRAELAEGDRLVLASAPPTLQAAIRRLHARWEVVGYDR